MLKTVTQWLSEYQQVDEPNKIIAQCIVLGIILMIAYFANLFSKGILLNAIKFLFKATKTNWDDILLKRHVFHRIVNFIPALIIWRLLPQAFPSTTIVTTIEGSSVETIASTEIATVCRTAMLIIMLVIAVRTINALLSAIEEIYEQYPISNRIPIKVFLQAVKIIEYLIAAIFFVAIVAAIEPSKILAGLGALTAVTMLVFKDTILSFVSGIQLITNKMVTEGDWIEMPSYGADGDVIDISLMTIKVQNWNKTISTIPTSALTTNSFKNWRGMTESGGRRIKRSISLDMNSIKFCTNEMLERFKKIEFISEYIDKKLNDVTKYNAQNKIDETIIVNGRRLTNIGTFRAYCVAYLKSHPKIHNGMTFLVRQLAPTESGVPIEIYVFSNDQNWGNYEDIQGDIFDHFLAVIPEFDLKVFQKLSEIK
jgi:miniconductance mechanosensitive channel